MDGESTILKHDGTVVPDVSEITGPEGSIAEVEKTPLGSASKRFRPSKTVEGGTFGFKLFYDPQNAVHAAIYAYRNASVTVEWTLEYSDGTTHVFDAFVTSAVITGLEQESEAMLEVECRIDGQVAETPGV